MYSDLWSSHFPCKNIHNMKRGQANKTTLSKHRSCLLYNSCHEMQALWIDDMYQYTHITASIPLLPPLSQHYASLDLVLNIQDLPLPQVFTHVYSRRSWLYHSLFSVSILNTCLLHKNTGVQFLDTGKKFCPSILLSGRDSHRRLVVVVVDGKAVFT